MNKSFNEELSKNERNEIRRKQNLATNQIIHLAILKPGRLKPKPNPSSFHYRLDNEQEQMYTVLSDAQLNFSSFLHDADPQDAGFIFIRLLVICHVTGLIHMRRHYASIRIISCGKKSIHA